MSELEQQALLDPPPRRVLRRLAGLDTWWGVDPSTVRVSVAWQREDGSCGALTRSFPRCEDGGRRLGFIHRETVEFVGELLGAGAGIPSVVKVEQPSGQYVKNPLVYAVGVIQAAIWTALFTETELSVPVETIPSSEWKKLALGRGDAGSKKRGGKAEIVRWARENGYTGTLEDEADAWGVATAARKLVAFE